MNKKYQLYQFSFYDESKKLICRYLPELETKNWHYYEIEDGTIFHLRKDFAGYIVGGTYDDIVETQKFKKEKIKF